MFFFFYKDNGWPWASGVGESCGSKVATWGNCPLSALSEANGSSCTGGEQICRQWE